MILEDFLCQNMEGCELKGVSYKIFPSGEVSLLSLENKGKKGTFWSLPPPLLCPLDCWKKEASEENMGLTRGPYIHLFTQEP